MVDSGALLKGRLVGVENERVIVRVRGRDVVVPVEHVQQVIRRGDSPRDSDGLATADGITTMAALMAIGAVTGFAIDYLHVGRQTVFIAPMRGGARPPGTAASPARRDRGVRIGYSVRF